MDNGGGFTITEVESHVVLLQRSCGMKCGASSANMQHGGEALKE